MGSLVKSPSVGWVCGGGGWPQFFGGTGGVFGGGGELFGGGSRVAHGCTQILWVCEIPVGYSVGAARRCLESVAEEGVSGCCKTPWYSPIPGRR